MAKKKRQSTTIKNRRASYDYSLEDSLVVGIVLNGREAKALRLGHGQLRGSYVNFRGNDLFLINATIGSTNAIPLSEQEQVRDRKLLAKKRELEHLKEAKTQGRTIVPTEILTSSRYIKLRIAVGKGKKRYHKRETIKKREFERRNAYQ
jgi:SsrA-binding protein